MNMSIVSAYVDLWLWSGVLVVTEGLWHVARCIRSRGRKQIDITAVTGVCAAYLATGAALAIAGSAWFGAAVCGVAALALAWVYTAMTAVPPGGDYEKALVDRYRQTGRILARLVRAAR